MKGLITPHLPVLAAALVLSVVWDLGHGMLSFESGAALVVGLCLGILLDFVAMRSPRMRLFFLMLLFVSMLDIFFLTDIVSVGIALMVGLYLALRLYRQIPPNVPVLVGAVFALSLPFAGKPNQGASPVDPPVLESTDDQFLVHLVLDELGAFNAVPLDAEKAKDVEELSAQYAKRGFLLYRNIESVSYDTKLSMGTLMDVSYVDNASANVQKVKGQNAYRVLNNPLQMQFQQKGWGVTVVQSQYVDYCQPGFSCYTYGWGSSSAVFEKIPDLRLRSQVLVREFLSTLISNSRGLELMTPFHDLIAGEVFPKGEWRNPALPFVAMSQLELLQNALIDGRGQNYVFAHILAPHFPWVYDKRCRVNDVDNWLLPYSGRADKPPGARQKATDGYWAQSVCVHQTLLGFIDSMDAAHPGRVRFVIHGDHGPRTMARNLKIDPQFAHSDQVRKNLQSPFVATRIVSDRVNPPAADSVLQTLLSGLLNAEARVMKAGT